MASNRFGDIFTITTWGESHGKAIGVVIDGCPAGLSLSEEEIAANLRLRQPGLSSHTSPRKEPDRPEILSGLFEGKTTGAPISIMIYNEDIDSSKYEPTQHLLKPGHANYTYLEKYGTFDYRGGGRASARETAVRVAAGAVAKKLLLHHGIEIFSYMSELGGIKASISTPSASAVQQSPLFCPDTEAEMKMIQALEAARTQGDSLGGIVETIALGIPPGLGDPIYEKLGANLARAMFSIPAVKGFEIGSGFDAARKTGFSNNDTFATTPEGTIYTKTNHAGGMLGGISTGMPLLFRVAFKPPSSIERQQNTIDVEGKSAVFSLSPGSRHDPCVAIRGVPVVTAMGAIVLANALLMSKLSVL